LSTATLSSEGAINTASQEAKEEGLAAMVDFRTNIIRAYNARERYTTGFQASNLPGFRNDVEFTNKRFYVMNDAFTGAVASPYQVTARLVGNQSPYTLSVVASGNGIRYVLQQRFSLPDFAYNAWYHKRSIYRDAVGMLQSSIHRSYLYQSNSNKFRANYDEAVLAGSYGASNAQQGIRCASPFNTTSCFPNHWGKQVQYFLNLGGGRIPIVLNFDTSGPTFFTSNIAFLGLIGFTNKTTPGFVFFGSGDAALLKEAAFIAHPGFAGSYPITAPTTPQGILAYSTQPAFEGVYPGIIHTSINESLIYLKVFDTPFQFTTPNNTHVQLWFNNLGLQPNLDWSEETMWDRTFGPNGVQG
ncbi:MAG: hypothetical protein ACKO34_05955, partial [Vampirovibrionales bacterium]